MDITVNEAQRRLARLWGIGAGAEFAILVWESTVGRVFGPPSVSDAWQWFLPLITPFLTLIIASVVAEAFRANQSIARSSDLAFTLAKWLSISYLCAIALSLFGAAWLSEPMGVLKTSSLWLTPIQAMVSIALGVFFTQRRVGQEASNGPAKSPAPGNG
jgi:hypothetical protein